MQTVCASWVCAVDSLLFGAISVLFHGSFWCPPVLSGASYSCSCTRVSAPVFHLSPPPSIAINAPTVTGGFGRTWDFSRTVSSSGHKEQMVNATLGCLAVEVLRLSCRLREWEDARLQISLRACAPASLPPGLDSFDPVCNSSP